MTVAGAASTVPSFTVKVKASEPTKFSAGVYTKRPGVVGSASSVPEAGGVTTDQVSASPSTSLAGASRVSGVSSGVVKAASWATGASFTGVTVTVKATSAEASTPSPAVPPSSTRRTVTVACPWASGAGSKLSVPSAASAGPAANSAGSDTSSTSKVTACPASSAGPADTSVAHTAAKAPLSSATVTSPPAAKAGASLTAVTVTWNVTSTEASTPPSSVPPSSTSRTVTVAAPFASAAGVKLSVPSLATLGPAANSPGAVLPVTSNVRPCPASSAGPALTALAQAAKYGPESSATATSPPLTKDGASFTGRTTRVKVCGAETPPSLSTRRTVISADPLASGAGVKVRVPTGLSAGPADSSAGAVLPTTSKATVWLPSRGPALASPIQWTYSAGPPSSSAHTVVAGRVKVGGSLSGVTVMVKVTGADVSTPPPAVPPSSWAVSTNSALP